MLRVALGLLAMVFLVACTADHKFASDAVVARAHYVDPNPPSITLMTSINTRTHSGAHAGLLINGTERVLFDPAGSFEHPSAPEREDMLYGMTPTMLSFYADYQGVAPFELIEQTIYVTPEIAEQVKQAAIKYGAANKAECTKAIATVLRDVPGFQSLPMTWFPKAMAKAFATLPGVHSQTITSLDGNRRGYLPGEPVGTLNRDLTPAYPSTDAPQG
ncbi:MAG: hypothetical protein ABI832_00540 [bacterium]